MVQRGGALAGLVEERAALILFSVPTLPSKNGYNAIGEGDADFLWD